MPYDAIARVLDGEARIPIDVRKLKAETGSRIIMPANIPHTRHAAKFFKISGRICRYLGARVSRGSSANFHDILHRRHYNPAIFGQPGMCLP